MKNCPVTDSCVTGKRHTGESKSESCIFKAPSQNYEKRLLASLCLSVCSPLRPSTWNNSTLAGRMVMKFLYEGWNFNSGNYLFTTDTK